MTARPPRAELRTVGLVLGAEKKALDRTCTFIGKVMDQDPHADVLVSTATAVGITTG